MGQSPEHPCSSGTALSCPRGQEEQEEDLRDDACGPLWVGGQPHTSTARQLVVKMPRHRLQLDLAPEAWGLAGRLKGTQIPELWPSLTGPAATTWTLSCL